MLDYQVRVLFEAKRRLDAENVYMAICSAMSSLGLKSKGTIVPRAETFKLLNRNNSTKTTKSKSKC